VRSVAIVTSLSGCMVIYPDPELPDIKLEWSGECDAGSEISIGLVNLDEGTTTRYAAPCTDNKLTLEDVDRKLFRVDGALVQADGSVSATASGEADLRNGFNKETFLYFEDPRLRVSWVFDMGDTCASLAVDTIVLDLDFPDQGYSYSLETSCDLGVYASYPFGQTLTLQLRGVSRRKTVAASPRTPTIDLTSFEEVTDLGTLTLTPCGSGCPSGPQSPGL
jgi:hypothetical protein